MIKRWPDPEKLRLSSLDQGDLSPEDMRAIMVKCRIGPRHLSSMLGVSYMTVWRWLNGKSPVSEPYRTMILELKNGKESIILPDPLLIASAVESLRYAADERTKRAVSDEIIDAYQKAYDRLLSLHALWEAPK